MTPTETIDVLAVRRGPVWVVDVRHHAAGHPHAHLPTAITVEPTTTEVDRALDQLGYDHATADAQWLWIPDDFQKGRFGITEARPRVPQPCP